MPNEKIPCEHCLILPICKQLESPQVVERCKLVRNYVFEIPPNPQDNPNRYYEVYEVNQERVLELREFLGGDIIAPFGTILILPNHYRTTPNENQPT